MKPKAELVRDWCSSAGGDLQVAAQIAAMSEPVTSALCFHSQQAAEKALKAWLVWRDKEPPRTHSLSALLQACAALEPSFDALDEVRSLTPFAVEGRYAVSGDRPTAEDAAEALRVAEQAVAFVADQLAAEGLDVSDLLAEL